MTPGGPAKPKLRLAYLAVSDELGPSSRYRIYQYREALAAAGIEVVVLPAFSRSYLLAERHAGLTRLGLKAASAGVGLLRRLSQLAVALRADGIVIERELFPFMPPFFESLLAASRGYVLELDDAVYLSRGRRLKYPATLRMARAVIVGNEVLAEFVRRHNERTVVVPTVVDLGRYTVRSDYELSSPPRIGWIGLPYNFGHLTAIAGTLARVCRERGARLVVISSRLPPLRIPMELVPWDLESEARSIAGIDVGLMPLEDTPFARGKCGLKLLQYMAAGVPAIGSPVGVNSEILRHRENGLIAKTAAEWHEGLTALLADRELRQRLGGAGRRTVEQEYSLQVWGERLARRYLEIFGRGDEP